jgi:Mg-chelatase subunit ChlD
MWKGFLLALLVGGSAAACSASNSERTSGFAYHDGSTGSGPSAGATTSGGADTTGTATGGAVLPMPGQLTAGAWDDNRNFDHFKKYLTKNAQLPGIPQFTDAERAAALDKSKKQPGGHDLLDIAVVIDTTGSMGDEIKYLQSEIGAIASTIDARYPSAQQRWALVAYKDKGDAYVVSSHDFAPVGQFQQELSKLSAHGGGDMPEAPEQALDAATKLKWRTSGAAHLLFWVADAPHHDADADAFATAVRAAMQSDLHIYPVASSGVDKLAEYSMRASAQLTGGRYLFLTDDSGIGGAHMEPEIPCYFVTKLNRAIERMVDIEMTGKYREPTKREIIRTGGDPKDGRCKMGEQEFVAF